MEKWEYISGHEEYMISSFGNVLSLKKIDSNCNPIKKNIKPCKDGRGYLNFSVTKDGKRVVLLIHREVAKAFIPNPLGLKLVRHKNDIKTDNNVSNLDWGTYSQNMGDAIRNNKNPKKHDLGHALIMYLYNSDRSCCQLARRYNISSSMVSKIKNGVSYSWLTKHKKQNNEKVNP